MIKQELHLSMPLLRGDATPFVTLSRAIGDLGPDWEMDRMVTTDEYFPSVVPDDTYVGTLVVVLTRRESVQTSQMDGIPPNSHGGYAYVGREPDRATRERREKERARAYAREGDAEAVPGWREDGWPERLAGTWSAAPGAPHQHREIAADIGLQADKEHYFHTPGPVTRLEYCSNVENGAIGLRLTTPEPGGAETKRYVDGLYRIAINTIREIARINQSGPEAP